MVLVCLLEFDEDDPTILADSFCIFFDVGDVLVVVAGLELIVFLVCGVGWVVRGFGLFFDFCVVVGEDIGGGVLNLFALEIK